MPRKIAAINRERRTATDGMMIRYLASTRPVPPARTGAAAMGRSWNADKDKVCSIGSSSV